MDNKDNKKIWTIRYTLLNVAYFAAFCTIHAYAAVYLLANGFTNTQVGVLLALANVVSALSQPVVAGFIDKPGPLTNKNFIFISIMVIMAGSVLLMVIRDNKIIIFIVYAIIYMVQFTYQPVMTALCFEYQKAGCNIMYGLSRGLGSAGFAVMSAIIGGMVEKRGVFILLVVNVIMMVISAVVILSFRKPRETGKKQEAAKAIERVKDGEEAAHNNIREFMSIYPAFSLFLVAAVCFYFAHNMINDFMIQIIRELGGAEKELGYANFLQAILELPVMALIPSVLKKVSAKKLLLLSGVSFLVKIIILIFARNMVGMYVSQSFQLLAYAVFIPAAAYYVNEMLGSFDQVKGQAFITTSITIGGVFSNLISGRILDKLGVRPMIVTGTVICAIGVIISFIAMTKLSDNTLREKALKD
ncbi:MAG: MFS transporter [Lachnospiraceae bacterium]|nr:MFS transporter [Lachnospiraceae bacterium]